MTIVALFIICAALCAIWSVVTIVLITVDLDKRGIKTNWLFMGPYIFRNLDLYRHKTIEASGKIGWLYERTYTDRVVGISLNASSDVPGGDA